MRIGLSAGPRFAWASMESCGGHWRYKRCLITAHFFVSCCAWKSASSGRLWLRWCAVCRKKKLGSSRTKIVVAVDATGLAPGAISTFFIRRREQHGGAPMPWRYWLKWLLAIDTRRRLILAQKAHQGPVNDCATLRPLLDEVVTTLPITTVLADAEFDSERNHRHIREQCRAKSIIPAKRTRPEWKLHGVRAQMRAAFPAKAYRQRVHAETVFSAIKRKLSARAPGRSLTTQRKQALLLGLAYNIYKLWPPQFRSLLHA